MDLKKNRPVRDGILALFLACPLNRWLYEKKKKVVFRGLD